MTAFADNIPLIRAVNQQLTGTEFKTAKDVAGWMGALQAQDYNMSKWAMGIRLPDSTEASIEMEIDSGRIIRTHLLRPTWHFVSADDIHWILALTAPRIKASLRSRDKRLGLTEDIYLKCNEILERSLRDSDHKTREEILPELKKSGIDLGENRASHIFLRAELDGLICSGKQKHRKPTYAMLDEWVPVQRKKSREEALKELAQRYFTSRGPATILDFTWWSGLSLTDAKLSLNLNKDLLTSLVIQNNTYWLANNYSEPESDSDEIFFLPSYDEFLICYRDRTASLSLTDNKKAVSNNGIFYPVIVKNGQIIGIWKRNIKNNKIILSKTLFKSVTRDQEKLMLRASTRYAGFIGRKIELI